LPNSKPYSNYQHHFGTLRVSHAFAPLLSRSSAPRIINVSSGAGQLDGKLQTWAPA